MKRGFEALIVMAVGLLVSIIMILSVIQPVINSQIIPQNQSGAVNNITGYSTAYTVVQQIPVLNAVAALVVIAGAILGIYAYAVGR